MKTYPNHNILIYITLFSMGLFAAGFGNQSLNGDLANVGGPDISGTG